MVGPRFLNPYLVGVCILNRKVVEFAGVRLWALIHPLVRWSVCMVQILTIALKRKLLLLLCPVCTLCSEMNLETTFSFPFFQRITSLVPCRCMNEQLSVSSWPIYAAYGREKGKGMGQWVVGS